LLTKFPYNNSLQKFILRTYSHYFYSEQRRKYTEEARQNLSILEKEIRVQLGIGE